MENLIPGNTTTIGDYLLKKLKQAGVKHIFGIPGDYVINFFSAMENGDIKTVIPSTEQGAAFAADAYSRMNGIGALCVTYCVGGLNTVNAVAGAYAEKAPLIVISGAPGICEYDNDYLLHHSIRDHDSQLNIFKEITVSQTRLCDPHVAAFEIDRVIKDCLDHKRPVYIELPRDMVDEQCLVYPPRNVVSCKLKPDALEEALIESADMVKNAKNPVIIGGVEIKRYLLEKEFTELLDKSGYPYVTTILGKSIINESHPQFSGVYMGKLGDENVQELIENSDCTIILGALMTDTNLGTAQLDISKTIYATADQLCIKHHYYKGIDFKEYLKRFSNLLLNYKKTEKVMKTQKCKYVAEKDKKITITRFFDRLDKFIPENTAVICDVGDSLFGSVDLTIPKNSYYLGPAYYTSMGYSVPAALGAQVCDKSLRPIVIAGDGAFQMTGQELSTIASLGLNPIIFILNNKGYTTQRFLKDGSYNDINNWNYHLWTEILGAGKGFEVNTEGDLETALDNAINNIDTFTIVNVHLDKYDKSKTLYRLTSNFKLKV